MLVRIVKMTFEEGYLDDFKAIFKQVKEKIRNFEGCNYVELLQDVDNPAIFFTYSHWESQESLNNYRNSLLFQETWSATKKLFASKAEAYSVEKIDF